MNEQPIINETLVQCLIAAQFPQWKDLPVRPVTHSGWDTTEIWEAALTTQWTNLPVWVHGDINIGNLLVQNGRLSAVIDFGQLTVGDPACDLAIAWTFLNSKSRDTFRSALSLDNATWARGRGWALWKALIVCAELTGTNPLEIENSRRVIDEILTDYRQQ